MSIHAKLGLSLNLSNHLLLAAPTDPPQPSKRVPEPLGRGAGSVMRCPGIVWVGPCLSVALTAMAGLSVPVRLTRVTELDWDQAERDPDTRQNGLTKASENFDSTTNVCYRFPSADLKISLRAHNKYHSARITRRKL